MMKILIVDDDPINIFSMEAALEAADYPVISAGSGQEALSIIEEDKDLRIVLMDIQMPEMDGYEAIGRIKNNLGQLPLTIVALTAKAMPGDKEKCLRAGADYYLAKPVILDELYELLKTINRAA